MKHLLETVWCTLKPSPIQGIGVFALRDITEGTQVIFEYDTVETCELTEAELKELPEAIQHEILARTIFIENEPLTFLDPNCVANFRSYLNHSADPNTDGKRALRDIKAGEELTESYTDMGKPHHLTQAHMATMV